MAFVTGFSESGNPKPDGLQLEISDDGKGMPVDLEEAGLRRGGGNGMRTMRQRAEEVGGSFEVTARINGGTRIRVFVPFEVHASIEA